MILVTGATGFLGHNLVPRLIEAGYPVRALVRHGSDTQFLTSLGVELAVANDVNDTLAVMKACQDCTEIIHAAGLFRFWGDIDTFRQTNVAGTQVVMEAALAHQVAKVIHISSIAVVGTTPVQQRIDETTPCRPQEPYQISKYEAEQVALTYQQEKDVPVVVLRPGAYYGPWGRYAFNRLFFEEPLRGWRIKVNGGRHITFPVFVPDVAEGILLALKHGRSGEIYNICGESLNHNAVNQIISHLAGINRWRLNIPTTAVLLLARTWTALSKYTGREPFYPINMAPYVFQDWPVSNQKARAELGFTPTPFTHGAQATLEWYWSQGILKR